MPSPPSVTTSRRVCTPPTFTLTARAASLPRSTPLSYSSAAPFHTWKTALPRLPTSSSMPTEALNRLQKPFRVYLSSDPACTPRPFWYTRPPMLSALPSPASCSPLLRSFSAGPQALLAPVQVRSESGLLVTDSLPSPPVA